ncbi:hypothetical protein PaeBR_05585 [Paenibacillus sp. BR2-3]|uniref:hypothetical protein n=1 Tax=Paenibacillus sp. BR2-3 TaxID=3048494 RepID=UPI003977CDA7
MKKTIVKTVMAVTMLLSMVLGQGAGTAAAASVSTKVPVITDNLSKYGLKKDVELPITVTAGGLSYTLHKIMILDFNSKTALTLRKQYKYTDYSGLIGDPQYFIWTKITITNKSKKTVERSYKDVMYKWSFYFEDGGFADPVDATSERQNKNSKVALHDFKLKPGESLTTYQALYYKGDFKYLRVAIDFDGQYAKKYVVNDPDLAQ